ncbi:uncharacterized protein LTR77_009176 [Saxophila tyrrhenica]|uniref:Ion transport domain-containing protein n=1 Tax=Saxophila tyrrhenica TaxID=1690608 RepID=A0AAV9P087_9PEZI|nr:hypothetical protein LTR77_009176 [Saxophila tyrrhenica]
MRIRATFRLDVYIATLGEVQGYMFSLLRSKSRGRKDNGTREYSPFAGSPEASRNRVVGRNVADEDYDDEDEDEDEEDARLLPNRRSTQQTSYFDRPQHDYEEEEEQEAIEDEDDIDTPLLPIFSAAHLDRLPLYNITHAIRLLIVQKCETTLSWDQLRSPQVSQFLVKPLQNQIRTNHFNRATLCALIANCLQFQKEAQLQPGNVGVLRTRALMSELLAMRLVKEFSTRELIDALSYDFDPLQGMSPPPTAAGNLRAAVWPTQQAPGNVYGQRSGGKVARVSTIEVAIKAQAKRFLAHQLVVQHLEAIWAGAVVFHSEADNLHRKPSAGEEPSGRGGRYGTLNEHSPSALPADSVLSRKAHGTRANKKPAEQPFARRSVVIYNPRDASLFKLSRLRVPRYRQIFSTVSFATMLGLFLAVLAERSLYITPLEVVFWFWSAGYMLDEIVGFTEQGFGLYILSFWNAFDLGILLLFIMYYCLRLYGILVAEQGKHQIANAAYDVLASTAILLFPRLFSVLDHYRYFSQLLIAFRMMAQDLAAILVLIMISCSGFFIAFTLSFADERTDGNAVIYQLFQILMGFTPAAWEKWQTYNILGQAIMTIFLILCHFLIVTILITVLTNSFMAIVQNANEEHQFLFAVNTISSVKSDALFSYIAPTNIFGWILSPLRYLVPFRQYVKINRTVIKATHFPMLLVIFGYERLILSHATYGPEDLLEQTSRHQSKPLAFSINKAPDVFSPGNRLLREPSVVSFHKDQALDEVFRRPFKGSTVRTTARDMGSNRRQSTNAVDKWMQVAENQGGASPPMEQPMSIVERLENQRPSFRRAATADRLRMVQSRDFSNTRSIASETDVRQRLPSRRPYKISEEGEDTLPADEIVPQETDADGDDEMINAESSLARPFLGESALSTVEKSTPTPHRESDEDDFFHTPTTTRSPMMQLSNGKAMLRQSPEASLGIRTPLQTKTAQKARAHNRKISTNTALFDPKYTQADDSSSTNAPRPFKPTTNRNVHTDGTTTPNPVNLLPGQRTPKIKPPKARPAMPARQKTAPTGIGGFGMSFLDIQPRNIRKPSFNARALDLASEIGDNRAGGIDAGGISGFPASFSEQLFRERELEREREEARRRSAEEEKGMVNRIMLARMHTLEEGFREVLKEIKDMSRSNANSSRRDSGDEAGPSALARGAVTPGGRYSGDGGKVRKSPKKRERQQAKVKAAPKSVETVRENEREAPSPESVGSVAEIARREEQGTEGGAERPGTAIRSPQPGTRSA